MSIQVNLHPVVDQTVIDATGLVVGRLASVVAKRLLSGEKIIIVNAENAVLAGKRSRRINELRKFLEIVGRANPKHGPRHPRRPDTMLRRVVRGMLPMDKEKGIKALAALKVYISVPSEIEGVKAQTIPSASASKLRCASLTLGTLASEVGWRGDVKCR
ncbi:MAG: 50S ribosomal protein L13 [Candidatus Bathyarchaeia archaeon]